MNRTKIEYLDYTWNPTVGCNGVDCAVREHCWAWAMAKRQKQHCQLCYDFKPHVHVERFTEPYHLIKGSRIGVSFMGDFYDKGIYETFREQIYNTIRACRRHTFILLTKQPKNIIYYGVWPGNLWFGVTVNRKADLWRIDALRERVGGVIRFVSFEPLYEDMGDIDLKGIEWVIIGAQTRPTFQPELDWVNNIIKQARSVGAAVFLKNNLGYVQLLEEVELRHRLQEFPK